MKTTPHQPCDGPVLENGMSADNRWLSSGAWNLADKTSLEAQGWRDENPRTINLFVSEQRTYCIM